MCIVETSFSAEVLLTCHDESEPPVHLADYVPDRYLYVVKLERGATFKAISQQPPSLSAGVTISFISRCVWSTNLTAQFDARVANLSPSYALRVERNHQN